MSYCIFVSKQKIIMIFDSIILYILFHFVFMFFKAYLFWCLSLLFDSVTVLSPFSYSNSPLLSDSTLTIISFASFSSSISFSRYLVLFLLTLVMFVTVSSYECWSFFQNSSTSHLSFPIGVPTFFWCISQVLMFIDLDEVFYFVVLL